MKRDEFKKELDRRGYKWKEEGEWIIVEEPYEVHLNPLVSIPDNVQFNNGGSVILDYLKSIPDNVRFNNRGYVDLGSLKSIPDNFQFNNEGNVYLDSLESIPINLDSEEIFQNVEDIRINHKWLGLEKNISFPESRWKSVDTGKVQMYESWVKNNY